MNNIINDSIVKHLHEKVLLRQFKEKYILSDTRAIEHMIDEIYNSGLDLIDDISYFYNIEFDDSGVDFNLGREKNAPIDERLVIRASYNPKDKRIHIFLTARGVLSLKHRKNKELLKKEVVHFYVHENIHAQQDKGNYDNSSTYKRVNNNSDFEEYLLYITQQVEIDAFARSVAEDLENNNININYMTKCLPKRKNSEPSEFVYFSYKEQLDKCFESFDLNTDTTILIAMYYTVGGDAWKRFLKQLYYFLPKRLTKEITT